MDMIAVFFEYPYNLFIISYNYMSLYAYYLCNLTGF